MTLCINTCLAPPLEEESDQQLPIQAQTLQGGHKLAFSQKQAIITCSIKLY